jgi:GGDEF domain-containing protein
MEAVHDCQAQGNPDMTADLERRRVLLAASAAARDTLQVPFSHEALRGWDAFTADSCERARFLVQHDLCDVLLLDESLCEDEARAGLAWLAGQHDAPVLLLSRPDPGLITAALQHGVAQWLPRELVLGHPPLLAAALRQALCCSERQRRARLAGESLQDSRRQVSRLVELLWESVPVEPRTRWFTQRYMMERLHEEVARTERHGVPFSVVLGEVLPRPSATTPLGDADLVAWTSDCVTRSKRRCDVAGQYGPHGFMLLLTNTSHRGATTFCRRLQGTLTEGAPLVAHFGVALCSGAAATPKSLLSQAEEQLERARTHLELGS